MRVSLRQRSKAQALVEFALAATLIFMLVAAAVDLGLIFLARQALRAAAQEGATFGSHPAFEQNGSDVRVYLDETAIRQRVRMTAGPDGGPVFANLTDLNNDGVADNDTVLDDHVWIENSRDINGDSRVPDDDPVNPGQVALCMEDPHMKTGSPLCYIRVTIQYNYKPIFPLAPALAKTVPIRVAFTMQMRNTYAQTN
jgi:hypothetical protein